MNPQDHSCIAALEAMDKHRRHVAIVHLIGAIVRNLGWFALGALLMFAAAKSHAQQFTAPDHQLPPDAIHLSPADTSLGVDPARGFQVPEPTTAVEFIEGGLLFAAVIGCRAIIKDDK